MAKNKDPVVFLIKHEYEGSAEMEEIFQKLIEDKVKQALDCHDRPVEEKDG